MSLSDRQRDELHRLLADELRAAWSAAVADGVSPGTLAEMLDERRAAIRSPTPAASASPPAEDVPGRGDDPGAA
jgi:hypothetical protein